MSLNNPIIKYIHHDEKKVLENILNDIHIKQYELSNSPNFYYKGDLYLYKGNKQRANGLHKSLRKSFRDYKEHLDNHLQRVNKLTIYLKTNNPKGEFYLYCELLPDELCIDLKLPITGRAKNPKYFEVEYLFYQTKVFSLI